MKSKQFWINLILYFLLLSGFLKLYLPFGSAAVNRPRAKVEFVYGRF
jgi:hypothetical protein